MSVIALTLLVAAGAARAQPEGDDKARATEIAKRAAKAYDAGDRVRAISLFEEAYATFPSPALLFNLGKAYRGVSRNAAAHRTWARYLQTESPDRITEARRKVVTQGLRDLERIVGRLEIVAGPSLHGAELLIDGAVTATLPVRDPIAVEPGVHKIVARRDGAVLIQLHGAASVGKVSQVTLEPNTSVPGPGELAETIEGRRNERDVTAAPSSANKPVYRKWWFWTAVTLAAAGTVGVVLAARGGDTTVDPSLGRFSFDQF